MTQNEYSRFLQGLHEVTEDTVVIALFSDIDDLLTNHENMLALEKRAAELGMEKAAFDTMYKNVVKQIAAGQKKRIEGTFEPFEPFEPPDINQLPHFPVESLPPALREFASAAAESLQVSADMPALAALTVAALCVQGKFCISPKPGWIEPLNLYTAIVARPSERKSPVFKLATEYLYTFTREENTRRGPGIAAYQTEKNILTKKLNALTEQAAKPGKGNKVTLADVVDVREELDSLEPVHPLRLLADDVTPEALTSLIMENDGKMSVVSSEGGLFDIITGLYGDKVNLDIFLKAYSNDPVQVDRKGRGSEMIERPALTMLLMIQPVTLSAVMENNTLKSRGLTARFIYSLPSSKVGRRRYETAAIPSQVTDDYERILWALLTIEAGDKPQIITLSPEAYEESKAIFEEIEPQLKSELEDMEGWAGKLHGQIMRIAGIMHCCRYDEHASIFPVSLETMQAARAIGRYLLAHAKAAFDLMGLTESPEEQDAKYILRKLDSTGESEISKRDLFQLCNGHLHDVQQLDDGLAILVEHGYIAIEKLKTGGRPTERVYLNPVYLSAKGSKGSKVQITP